VCPLTPPLKRAPSFLYMGDTFAKPLPFSADLVFGIDAVLDLKFAMQAEHVSQLFEWLPWERGLLSEVPAEPAARLVWLKADRGPRDQQMAETCREQLITKYGPDEGRQIHYAEAFEFCEYGGAWLRKSFDPKTGRVPCFDF